MNKFLRSSACACVTVIWALGDISAPSAAAEKPKADAPKVDAPKLDPNAAPVTADPQATTATFGDWLLRCQRVGTEAKAVRICEVALVLVPQGRQQPIAEIAIGRPDAKSALRMTAVVPISISIPTTPRIDLGAEDPKPLNLTWRACTPNGCVAANEIDEETLKRWRSSPSLSAYRASWIGTAGTCASPIMPRPTSSSSRCCAKAGS